MAHTADVTSSTSGTETKQEAPPAAAQGPAAATGGGAEEAQGLGKRPVEESSSYSGGGEADQRNKRHHAEGASDRTGVPEKPFAMKVLVSNKDAGTVIGRGGATISSMQTKSGARIRVSNANEYFPGTQDRVVLLSGDPASVTAGVRLVLEEVFCNAESLQNDPETGAERQITLRMLIPQQGSGQIIGKGGENIKRMQEESGSKISLTTKEQQVPGVDERVLTVAGSIACMIKGAEAVVNKISEDVTIRFTNHTTNYKHAMGGGGGGWGGPPRGGPNMGGYGAPPQGYGGYGGHYGAPQAYGGYQDPYAAYGQQHQQQQYPGYGQQQGQQPPAAMDYAAYGQQQQGAYGQQQGSYGYGQEGQQHAGYGAPPGAPPPAAGGYGAPAGGGGAGSVSYQLLVPDHVVPAILGRAGAVIKELMEQSGAVIKVSQKGEYAPGTTNRVITITGTQHAASYAHQLVSAKIPQQ